MRHRHFVVTFTVGPLPPTMGLTPRLACLIALARRADLIASLAFSTLVAAVALATVATGADGKHHTAFWLQALAWPKAFDVTVGIPHPINLHPLKDDRTDDCAFGADDVEPG